MEQSLFQRSRSLRISPAGSPESRRYQPVKIPPLARTSEPRQILHFDIETRLVGFHKGGRFAPDGCEPIAMAWMVPGEEVRVSSMGSKWRKGDLVLMLEEFREAYDAADMVTGHYVLKFDLPVINGAMLEFGREPLSPKLVSDTKVHLFRRAAVSASQENLALMRRVEAAKMKMSDTDWREAARLTQEGIGKARDRVEADVEQHHQLRTSLIENNYLRSPSVWRS